MAPGAFLTLGAVIAAVQKIKKTLENKKKQQDTQNDGEEVII